METTAPIVSPPYVEGKPYSNIPELWNPVISTYGYDDDSRLLFGKYLPRLRTWDQVFKVYNTVGNMLWIPALFTVLYLIMIGIGPKLMENRPAFKLKKLSICWNIALALFSIQGAFICVPRVLNVWYHNGFSTTVCNPALMDMTFTTWLFLFVYSKVFELFDTVLLILKKKPVIFLHWFHHTTVLWVCWLSHKHGYLPGIWFCAMNFFVHSIMYSYYAATQMGFYKYVSPFAPLITTLQLVQMAAGAEIVALSWVIQKYGWFDREAGQCNPRGPGYNYVTNGETIDGGMYHMQTSFLFIYVAYGLLFAKFGLERYFGIKLTWNGIESKKKSKTV